jgi:NAD+ synthase
MQEKKIVDHIVSWLKEYAQNANSKGFVVGVSGGIDSALTASLAAKTGLPLLCVDMPIHQNENEVNRAKEFVDQLMSRYANVAYHSVNLSPVFDIFQNQVKSEEINTERTGLGLINSRARLRMTTLYYLATTKGYLVAGTGNKVEDFGIGFFTKYGDGGVDLSPIADLTKTEVYALAKELDVTQAILDAPPTDGLWGDDRTDEDQIGASYPELEWAMQQVSEGKIESEFEGRELEVFKIYTRLNRANKHKMQPIPVCDIPYNLKF